jgi:alpha-amylase/alpha-mannosidase (GH57 family)
LETGSGQLTLTNIERHSNTLFSPDYHWKIYQLMPTRALCIHGHFYQPPREDPFTGKIYPEAGAEPYNNWNERIHAECYRPNAQLGNFERISFNVGPTLFPWLATHDPATYRSIIEQDRSNLECYGMGNAIAQAYNHTILPLATTGDKIVQIVWGIADFQHRFGRPPKGMWLPETAVDLETLALLNDHGIEFTILAPWQANTESLDATEPYLVKLPGGRAITVFFFQRELSSRLSFDPGATANADRFALYDLAQYYQPEKTKRGEAQLLLLASDGELYGHHQRFREHFLAHLLNGASVQASLTPTFLALWLKQYPPRQTIEIREMTSWSCHHGIARWQRDCACASAKGVWKRHLRKALDRLANALDWTFFEATYPHVSTPRVLREKYIHAILGKVTSERLINELADHALTGKQNLRLRLLLEAQRERQRMFTSCGWFFEDFDRIEPKNNLAYAARAVQLTRLATGEDLAPEILADLKKVVSPSTKLRGDRVFKKHLKRAQALENSKQKHPGQRSYSLGL